MTVDVVGEPWQLDEPPSGLLRRVESLHVAPLLRSDFDAAALERLGSGRRLLLDAQGLVRVPKTGPLTLDADFDPDVLRHVSILKVSEEEADVLAGGDRDALADLGVPEIVLTLGRRGSVVIVNGRAEEIPARPVDDAVDPTGAGDAFASAYLSARAGGHAPASAARRATALVAALLLGHEPMIAAVRHDRRRRAHRPRGRASLDRRDRSCRRSTRPTSSCRASSRPRAPARRSSRSSTGGRRSRSRATTARRGARPAAGCPTGFAVAIAEDDPDRMLYAGRNRLYVSVNGGVFWRALTLELPDVLAVAWID